MEGLARASIVELRVAARGPCTACCLTCELKMAAELLMTSAMMNSLILLAYLGEIPSVRVISSLHFGQAPLEPTMKASSTTDQPCSSMTFFKAEYFSILSRRFCWRVFVG